MSEDTRHGAFGRSVIIVGRNTVQNRLLADTIDARTGYLCLVRPVDGVADLPPSGDALALLDIEDLPAKNIASSLQSLAARPSGGHIAVINADSTTTFAQLVNWPAVRGVFFREASRENLIKGIQGIFDGEYWLPRKMLGTHLEKIRMRRPVPLPQAAALTPKEIETLRLLVDGKSNSRIARRLSVSPHTVKTHVYNLFRKIHVHNRVQAVQWAMQNISGLDGLETDSNEC